MTPDARAWHLRNIRRALREAGMDPEAIEAGLQAIRDDHAHGLAEKVRAGKGTYYPESRLGGDGWIAEAAADLIDPDAA